MQAVYIQMMSKKKMIKFLELATLKKKKTNTCKMSNKFNKILQSLSLSERNRT